MAYEPGKPNLSPFREFTMICGACEHYDTQHWVNKQQAIAQYRKDGWRQRKGQWVCPACTQKSTQPGK